MMILNYRFHYIHTGFSKSDLVEKSEWDFWPREWENKTGVTPRCTTKGRWSMAVYI